MNKTLKLYKNNDNKDWTDLEWINEFSAYLQGEKIESLSGHFKPKLTRQQAFRVIWYLQEHFPILPDSIEQCSKCDDLYNGHSSGYYSEKQGAHFCDSCMTPFMDEDEG